MEHLVIRLLGGLDVGRGAAGVAVAISSRKTRALLAYLALRPDHAHPRDTLTELLWPDVNAAHARQSLRQALVGLRRVLAVSKTRPLVIENDTVALDSSKIDVDVARFERLIVEPTRPRLEQAVAVYRGDLLEGFHVGASSFEDWLLTERERLRELVRHALTGLLGYQTRARGGEAIHTANRLLALDPLREDVHRALMHLYVARGQRPAALRQYQACVGVLRRELGVEPDADTKHLYREILQQPAARGATTAAPPSHAGDRRRRAYSNTTRVHGEPALIGRDAEIARLRAVRDEAWQGRARVVFVTGEAGIGKTRVLEQLALEVAAGGGRVLAGRFHETEQMLPFQAWIDAFRSKDGLCVLPDLGEARRELARLFPELGPAPGGTGSPLGLLEAMMTVVERLAPPQGLLLVLDDLHWADAMSVRLLSFIARRIGPHPVLIAGSAREEDLPDARILRSALEELERDERVIRLALSPLSQVQTVDLVRALLRRGSAEASVERMGMEVWRTSEGNPFVILETVRDFLEGATAPGAERPLVPRRVRDLVAARLERLTEPSRRLASVAAVIGRDFSFALLRRSARRAPREAAEALEELVRRRIMSAVGDGFDFTHDRLRRVAYDLLLEPRRRALHAAVVEALEALHAGDPAEVYDRLAHHSTQAGMDEKAVTYLCRFGELARRRYAHAEALRAFDRALEIVERIPAAGRDRLRLHIVLHKAGVLSLMTQFREILDLLSGHRARIELLGDPGLAGPFFFRLGLTHAYLSHRDEALDAIRRALNEAHRAGDDAVAGQAHYALMLVSHWWDTPKDGIVDGDRAVELLKKAGTAEWLAMTHAVRAVCHHAAGNLDEALSDAVHAETLGAALGEARVQSIAAGVAAFVHIVREDWQAGAAEASRATEAARDPLAVATAQVYTGILALEHGDADRAVRVLTEAVEGWRRFGSLAAATRHQGHLAEAHRRAGDHERARKLALEVLAISDVLRIRAGAALASRTLGRIAMDHGTVAEAKAHLEIALENFASVPMPFEAGRTHLDLAVVSDRPEHLSRAAEIFTRLRLPTWLARATAPRADLSGRLDATR